MDGAVFMKIALTLIGVALVIGSGLYGTRREYSNPLKPHDAWLLGLVTGLVNGMIAVYIVYG